MTDFLNYALARTDVADFQTHLMPCQGCRVYPDRLRQTITLNGRIA